MMIERIKFLHKRQTTAKSLKIEKYIFPIIKYYVRIEKIKFLHKRQTTAIGKRFM